eukprot:365544-Chlamydomonas_euryale.AAC.5
MAACMAAHRRRRWPCRTHSLAPADRPHSHQSPADPPPTLDVHTTHTRRPHHPHWTSAPPAPTERSPPHTAAPVRLVGAAAPSPVGSVPPPAAVAQPLAGRLATARQQCVPPPAGAASPPVVYRLSQALHSLQPLAPAFAMAGVKPPASAAAAGPTSTGYIFHELYMCVRASVCQV